MQRRLACIHGGTQGGQSLQSCFYVIKQGLIQLFASCYKKQQVREDTFRQITRLHLRHIKCCINNRSFSNRHASKHIHAHMFVWVCEHSPSNTSKRAQTHCQPIFQPSWKSHWLEHTKPQDLTNHEGPPSQPSRGTNHQPEFTLPTRFVQLGR